MEYVYLHGFLSGPTSHKGSFFRKCFAEFGLQLHCPDLNEGDFEHLTITRQLKLIEQLVSKLGNKITLLGSSLGGYLATLAAERHKEIRRLVLFAPAFDFINRYADLLSPQQLHRWKEEKYIELNHYNYRKKRKLHFKIVEDARQYREIQLQRQLPAQIFHGIKDSVVPFQLSVDYLQSHPMADLILLNSDHDLLDKLDVIWDYMKIFLELK